MLEEILVCGVLRNELKQKYTAFPLVAPLRRIFPQKTHTKRGKTRERYEFGGDFFREIYFEKREFSPGWSSREAGHRSRLCLQGG